MKAITPSEINEIISDINNELKRLKELEKQIKQVQKEMINYPQLTNILFESLALKLHNFYTGCERIFQIIASELNGGKPSSFDWHRRLLDRMQNDQAERPAVIRGATAKKLQDYLSFRHVVRNIYGFELDITRLKNLVDGYYSVWHDVEEDLRNFLDWLNHLKTEISS